MKFNSNVIIIFQYIMYQIFNYNIYAAKSSEIQGEIMFEYFKIRVAISGEIK